MNKVNKFLLRTTDKTWKTMIWTSITSFLVVAFFPKGVKFFITNWFAGLAKTVVHLMLSGLITQKIVDWLVEHE